MKWYSYFNKRGEKNLLDNESIFNDNLLICQQLDYRRYTLFKNFSEFSIFFRQTPFEQQCFYEMMRETDGRKPYFDIDLEDMEVDYKKMLKEIKEIIFSMIGKDIRFLVFDSSTGAKRSFHIVIDKVYLQTYKELLVFFDKVKLKLSEEFKIFLDSSVYKTVQQFRMYKSHKYQKLNIKNFSKQFSHNFTFPRNVRKETAKFNFMLASSIITNIGGCRLLGGFHPEVEEKSILISGSAHEGDIEDVMKLFYKEYSYGDFEFQECKEKNGNLLIILRRLNSTFCKLCNRYHENENPYITVTSEYRNITFYCRRSEENQGISIGSLGIPDYTEVMKLEPAILENLTDPKNLEITSQSEKESREDIVKNLEDISEIEQVCTPKRKANVKKSLQGLKLGSLVY